MGMTAVASGEVALDVDESRALLVVSLRRKVAGVGRKDLQRMLREEPLETVPTGVVRVFEVRCKDPHGGSSNVSGEWGRRRSAGGGGGREHRSMLGARASQHVGFILQGQHGEAGGASVVRAGRAEAACWAPHRSGPRRSEGRASGGEATAGDAARPRRPNGKGPRTGRPATAAYVYPLTGAAPVDICLYAMRLVRSERGKDAAQVFAEVELLGHLVHEGGVDLLLRHMAYLMQAVVLHHVRALERSGSPDCSRRLRKINSGGG